jgi:hypothetical protein
MGRVFSSVRGFAMSMLPVLSGYAMLRYANQSIEAWKVQETAIANVESGLNATNNAIGLSSKKLQKMATSWQKVGIFGDETILQNVTAQLLTFGSIGKQNFDRMQGAAMDLTTKLYGTRSTGEQLRDVTIMLGKAMDDPVKGMTALRRRGIQFTEQQQNQIKTLYRSQGRLAAQNRLLKEIEKLYGGTNRAIRKTTAGMEIASKMTIGDAMEKLGKVLIPIKLTFLSLITEILPPFVQIITALLKMIYKLRFVILGVTTAIVAWKIATYSLIAAQKIMMAFNVVKVLGFIGAIKYAVIGTKLWAAAQWLLNASMAPMILTVLAIVAAVGLLVLAGIWVYKKWDAIIGFLSRAWDSFKEKFIYVIDITWEYLRKFGRGFMTYMLMPLNLMITGVTYLIRLISKIPGLGKYAAVADYAEKLQTKMNRAVGAQTAQELYTTYVSPESKNIASGRETGRNTTGNVNINVSGPKEAMEVEQRGTMPMGMSLNVGAQG